MKLNQKTTEMEEEEKQMKQRDNKIVKAIHLVNTHLSFKNLKCTLQHFHNLKLLS